MLETKILKYFNHLGDSEYMAAVVTSTGAVDTLIKLLKSNDEETVSYACLFITDFVLICSRNNTCKEFWESKLESAIIPELEHLVLADHHFIRRQVIYTLGKICSYNSVPVLLHAFYELRDKDPLLLPRLIGELFWLGVDNGWDLIDSMTASNQYTTRWAVLQSLTEFIYDSQNEDQTFLMRYKFCDRLRQDSHPLVLAEAEYEYQFLELNRHKFKENLSKLEYKKKRKELKKLESSLPFFRIYGQFGKYMYDRKLHTYSIEELESFVDEAMAGL